MDPKFYNNKIYRIILILHVFGFFIKNKGTLLTYLDLVRKKFNLSVNDNIIYDQLFSNNSNNNSNNSLITKLGSLFNLFNFISYSSSPTTISSSSISSSSNLINNNLNNNYNNKNNNYKDNYNELLFWKIIKNKSILNNILSNLSNGPNFNSYKYYEIIHVDWMINNNKKELLDYKVKNGDYLIFNIPFLNNNNNNKTSYSKNKNNKTINLNIYNRPNNQSPQNNELYIKLFKFIKKDQEFYINLFRNYSNYFLIDIESTIKQAIKVKSFGALKVLFGYYNAKLTLIQEKEIFDYCITSKNFKSLNFIIESKFLHHNGPIKVTPKDIILLFNDCPFGEIGIPTNVTNDSVYDIKSNPSDNTNREERSFKLSKLIHACKLINYLLDSSLFLIETSFPLSTTTTFSTELNSTLTSVSNYQFNLSNIISRDHINSFNFTKNQLKSSIINLLKSSDQEIKNHIESLIRMYLTITNQQEKNIRYYLTFNENSIDDQTISSMEIKETFSKCCMIAFRYGNYTLIKRWFNKLSKTNIFFEMILFQSWVGELFKRYESPEFLFEHCNNSNDKSNINKSSDYSSNTGELEFKIEKRKRNFIDSICNDIIDPQLNKDFKFHPLFLFCLCIATDDLEIIRYTHSKLTKITPIELDPILLERHLLHHNFSLCLYRYIRSTKVFDFIYQHFNNNGSIPINGQSITSWYHFGKTTLLKHYQTLIEANDPEARVPFSRKPYGIENQVSSKSVVHILSNTRKFRIDYHYMIECIDGQFIDIVELNDIKYIISNCHCSAKKVKFNIIMVMTSPKFTQGQKIEFFDWFFRNNPSNYLDYFGDYNLDLNKRILSSTHMNLINGYLYLTGRLDQVLLNNTNIEALNNLNSANNSNETSIIKDITDMYHSLGLKISKNLSLFNHDNCDEIFYCIGLLNDTDTLDLIMVLDNHLNSNNSSSFNSKFSFKSNTHNNNNSILAQQYIINKKRYLFEMLCGAVHYGRLSMLQYFYNNYKSIFLEYYHNNNHTNNNNNNNSNSNSSSNSNSNNNDSQEKFNSKILFKDAIINNYYDMVEWFINVLDLKLSSSILFDSSNNNNNNNYYNHNSILTEKDFKNSIIYKNFKNMIN